MIGLEGAFTALVQDLDPALRVLMSWVGYALAVFCFIGGCLRLLRHAGGHWPGTATGTAALFVLSPIMANFPGMLIAGGGSLFGADREAASAMAWIPPVSGEWARFGAAMKAAFIVVAWIGLFAFVRGWFVLKNAVDGRNQATLSQAGCHLLGGVLAWHMAGLVRALQETTGVKAVPI